MNAIAIADRPTSRRQVRRGGDAISILDMRVPTWERSLARVMFEERWMKNCAYFAGKHHFALIGNQLIEITPGKHEIRYAVNYIKPAVLRSVSKLQNMRGRFAVAPMNGSPRAREMARTTMHALGHIKNVTDYDYEEMMCFLWAAVCGTSFMRHTFNPEAGEPDRYYWFDKEDRTVIPEWSLSGEERARRDREHLYDDVSPGEIEVASVSPFQVYPDPASRGRMKECRHITLASYLEKGVVAEAFGVDEKDLKSDSGSASALRWEQTLAYMSTGTSGSQGMFYTPSKIDEDKVLLRQSWERPSRKNKFGKYYAAAGDLVLADGKNPYAGDRTKMAELPLSKLDWIPGLDRFWGYGLVDDLTSPQFQRNQSRARMFEFERIHGRATTFVPKGSGIPPGELSIKQGQVVEYNPSVGTIQFAPVPQLPKEVYLNAESCRQEIAELSAGSDIDGTKLPGQIRSGEGLEAIRQERDIILSVTSQSALRFTFQNCRQMIALAQMFYDNERLAVYRGPNGEYGVQAFKSGDLSNELKIVGEAGTVETLQQQRALILDAVQARALTPDTNPQHAQAVFKGLAFNTSEEVIDDLLMHEARQEAEIREMVAHPERYDAVLDPERAKPYPIMPFEDNQAHMRVLVRYFHSDEWPLLTPQIQGILMMHYHLHEAAEQKKLLALMQMQEAARGAPGAKGQASQPAG